MPDKHEDNDALILAVIFMVAVALVTIAIQVGLTARTWAYLSRIEGLLSQ